MLTFLLKLLSTIWVVLHIQLHIQQKLASRKHCLIVRIMIFNKHTTDNPLLSEYTQLLSNNENISLIMHEMGDI